MVYVTIFQPRATAKLPKTPPHLKRTRLKMHFFSNGNSLYGPASWMHTKGDMSDMPSMQPTEQPRTSPRGWSWSEHMPRRPSCVCLPECSVSRVMATGALEAWKVVEVIRLAAWAVNYFTDQLMTPYFSGESTINGTPGGDRWARILGGQIGWLS